jgi:3-oxoacyl-[acyl-carrier protein] reductase
MAAGGPRITEEQRHKMHTHSRFLEGRTAIVTGSGRNIGRAIALAFAGCGANVVINGHRDRAALDAVVKEAEALGVSAMAAVADVGDADAVANMVEAARDRFGAVDIAVSNVSRRNRQAFEDISLDDWRSTLNINLNSVFYLNRAVLPQMKQRGWGRLINISGHDGWNGAKNRAHNVTCKAGMHALAKAIALEYGPYGITANTIAPGTMDTIRDAKNYPNYIEEFEKRRMTKIAVRRLGRSEDVAEAALFLCTEGGGFVTGDVIHSNGGEYMF